MEDILVPIVAIVSVFGGSILFVKTLTDFWLKRKMVDKGLVGEEASAILAGDVKMENRYSGLKWGLITLFAGIGLVIVNFLPRHFDHETSMPYGIFCISVAVGFLIYYAIMNKKLSE